MSNGPEEEAPLLPYPDSPEFAPINHPSPFEGYDLSLERRTRSPSRHSPAPPHPIQRISIAGLTASALPKDYLKLFIRQKRLLVDLKFALISAHHRAEAKYVEGLLSAFEESELYYSGALARLNREARDQFFAHKFLQAVLDPAYFSLPLPIRERFRDEVEELRRVVGPPTDMEQAVGAEGEDEGEDFPLISAAEVEAALAGDGGSEGTGKTKSTGADERRKSVSSAVTMYTPEIASERDDASVRWAPVILRSAESQKVQDLERGRSLTKHVSLKRYPEVLEGREPGRFTDEPEELYQVDHLGKVRPVRPWTPAMVPGKTPVNPTEQRSGVYGSQPPIPYPPKKQLTISSITDFDQDDDLYSAPEARLPRRSSRRQSTQYGVEEYYEVYDNDDNDLYSEPKPLKPILKRQMTGPRITELEDDDEFWAHYQQPPSAQQGLGSMGSENGDKDNGSPSRSPSTKKPTEQSSSDSLQRTESRITKIQVDSESPYAIPGGGAPPKRTPTWKDIREGKWPPAAAPSTSGPVRSPTLLPPEIEDNQTDLPLPPGSSKTEEQLAAEKGSQFPWEDMNDPQRQSLAKVPSKESLARIPSASPGRRTPASARNYSPSPKPVLKREPFSWEIPPPNPLKRAAFSWEVSAGPSSQQDAESEAGQDEHPTTAEEGEQVAPGEGEGEGEAEAEAEAEAEEPEPSLPLGFPSSQFTAQPRCREFTPNTFDVAALYGEPATTAQVIEWEQSDRYEALADLDPGPEYPEVLVMIQGEVVQVLAMGYPEGENNDAWWLARTVFEFDTEEEAEMRSVGWVPSGYLQPVLVQRNVPPPRTSSPDWRNLPEVDIHAQAQVGLENGYGMEIIEGPRPGTPRIADDDDYEYEYGYPGQESYGYPYASPYPPEWPFEYPEPPRTLFGIFLQRIFMLFGRPLRYGAVPATQAPGLPVTYDHVITMELDASESNSRLIRLFGEFRPIAPVHRPPHPPIPAQICDSQYKIISATFGERLLEPEYHEMGYVYVSQLDSNLSRAITEAKVAMSRANNNERERLVNLILLVAEKLDPNTSVSAFITSYSYMTAFRGTGAPSGPSQTSASAGGQTLGPYRTPAPSSAYYPTPSGTAQQYALQQYAATPVASIPSEPVELASVPAGPGTPYAPPPRTPRPPTPPNLTDDTFTPSFSNLDQQRKQTFEWMFFALEAYLMLPFPSELTPYFNTPINTLCSRLRHFQASPEETGHAEAIVSPAEISAPMLRDWRGITFKWTTDPGTHLKHDPQNNIVWIYGHVAFTYLHFLARDGSSLYKNGFHAQHAALNEIASTYRLLFGDTEAGQSLFDQLDVKARPDGYYDIFGALPVSDTKPRLQYNVAREFPLYGERLLVLRKLLKPTGLRGLWKDKRDSLSWYTFWAVVFLGMTGVVMGLVQTSLGAVQAWASLQALKTGG